jgi:hypothetical protein
VAARIDAHLIRAGDHSHEVDLVGVRYAPRGVDDMGAIVALPQGWGWKAFPRVDDVDVGNAVAGRGPVHEHIALWQ